MAQHFLKSATKRNFPPYEVLKMTEQEAFEMFVELRWDGFHKIVCPFCAVVGKHYFKRLKKQWICKDCHSSFSVTTHTKFQDHKLSFKQMLFGIAEFITSPNGISLHTLSAKMGVNIKTAQSFVGKLREGIFDAKSDGPLEGLVHVDGGHFGGRPRSGRVRRPNKTQIQEHVIQKLKTGKAKRSGRTIANWKRMQNRRVVMVLRDVHPTRGRGSINTRVAVCMSENEINAMQLAKKYISPDAVVMTDENAAYNQFSTLFEHKTVVHSQEFATLDGVSDNQAESYFARLRRHVIGVSHRIEPKYMMDIATEMSWREDVRRLSDREKAQSLLRAVLKNGQSRWWRGYWQRRNRPYEILWPKQG